MRAAQNELYSSVWAPQLDQNHGFPKMIRAICGPKLAHFQRPFGLERGQNAPHGLKMGSFHLFVHPK